MLLLQLLPELFIHTGIYKERILSIEIYINDDIECDEFTSYEFWSFIFIPYW